MTKNLKAKSMAGNFTMDTAVCNYIRLVSYQLDYLQKNYKDIAQNCIEDYQKEIAVAEALLKQLRSARRAYR